MADEYKVYYGEFESREDVEREFDVTLAADVVIRFARYDAPSYEGYAMIVYEQGDKVYEVHGSHCSCFGLEGQWTPEETSWEALKHRPESREYEGYDETGLATCIKALGK